MPQPACRARQMFALEARRSWADDFCQSKTEVNLTAANHSHLSANLRDYADELFEIRSSLAALAMNADQHKDVILRVVLSSDLPFP